MGFEYLTQSLVLQVFLCKQPWLRVHGTVLWGFSVAALPTRKEVSKSKGGIFQGSETPVDVKDGLTSSSLPLLLYSNEYIYLQYIMYWTLYIEYPIFSLKGSGKVS